MKIGTTEKLKFKNLQRRLRLPVWQAVGLLETLWKTAYRNAPAGDIGRLTNDEIAAAIEWGGDADELVDALVATRWLDADQQHRLLVHDWEQECESWLRANFERHKRQFAKPTHSQADNIAQQPTCNNETQDRKQPQNEPQQPPSKPSLSFPSIPYPTTPLDSGDVEPEELPAEWQVVVEELFSEGVNFAEAACKSARGRGCTPSDVLFVMEQWRERRPHVDHGTLYNRIKNLVPDRKVTWPECPEWEREKARKQNEERQNKTAREARNGRKAKQAEIEAEAERERNFGGKLDAMSADELDEITSRIIRGFPLYVDGKMSALARQQLLLELERQASYLGKGK